MGEIIRRVLAQSNVCKLAKGSVLIIYRLWLAD
jgi:hypothetical protein